MSFDTRLSWPIFLTIILCLCFPLVEGPFFNSLNIESARVFENLQATSLLLCAIITFFYIKPFTLTSEKKVFWLWAVCWWVLLFGRSTSWGRDYFPEVPKIYFRSISVVLIGAVVFPLFSANLRKEIANKFKTVCIPLWGVIMALMGLIISDSIEQHRLISHYFVNDIARQDLVEELYEFPFIFGLFYISFVIMKQDKIAQIKINAQ